MQGAVLYGPRDVRLEERDVLKLIQRTVAIIRISAACVCGSDLWPYRGIQRIAQPTPMGHEYCGIVEEVGSAVTSVNPGQFVIGSFFASDNICPTCQIRYQSSCQHRELVGGAQAPLLRVPLADGTLVATSDVPSENLIPSLLTLSQSDRTVPDHHNRGARFNIRSIRSELPGPHNICLACSPRSKWARSDELRDSEMSTWPKNSIASNLLFSTLLLVASLVAVDASKASERTTNMKIRISIADKVVIATVADNATARDFVSVLPLSVSMKDLFGREKYGDLPKALSENGPRKNTYEVGEIAYWSPDHQFAVYYHQDGESIPSPGVIPIATIDAGAKAFNVPGSVKVTIAVAK